MIADEVNYCPRCGTKLVQAPRFGKTRPTCSNCEWIFFADPKVAVAILIEQDSHVLLVRRAVDPQKGLWTLPAGFVDAGEHPARAAERECLEETGLVTRITELLDVFAGREHQHGADIVIFYRAEIVSGVLCSGDDVDKVCFFPSDKLPSFAFSTTSKILSTIL